MYPEELSDNRIFDELNERQSEAVRCLNGPLLIIAGAGSGKTKALTHRIANLIYRGVKPWKILSLTFTNKAAGEMKERIGRMIGEEKANQISAGTFHSVFAMILRREARYIGYTNNFTIYDTDDTQAVIRGILKDFNIKDKEITPQGVRSKISWAKNQMMSVTDFRKSSHNRITETIGYIYEEYQRRLLQSNAMDFDDLLLNMVKLLNKEEILEKYRNRYDHILVDEYQDTNRVQYLIINSLAKAHQNICVVGDDAQSIYKWRGADIRNILDFKRDYPDANVVRLEQNYRSTKNIIGAADSLIRYNQAQLPKTLWTDNEDGSLIDLNQYDSDFDESDATAKKIAKLIKLKKYELNDFAVLYRTNAQSLSLEKAMKNQGLKYMVVGGVSFYSRKEIKDVLAYLKILVNPRDNEALSRIINIPLRNIGNTTLSHFQNFAKEQNISLFEALKRADEIPGLQKSKIKAVSDFVDFVDNYTGISSSSNPVEDVMDYIKATNIRDYYKEMTTEDAEDRVNNIDQLFVDIEHYFISNQDASLEEYLQQSALVTDADKKDLMENSIKLMTLHSAKGLEFPYVFIVGLEQGLFPLGFTDESPEDLEEERRLMYVGITRAEKHLSLSHCLKRFKFGDVMICKKSRFLKEIDEKFLQTDDDSNTEKRYKNKNNYNDTFSQVGKSDNFFFDDIPAEKNERKQEISNSTNKIPVFLTIKTGDVVNHKLFGLGRVEELNGIADNKQALIMFKSVGKKKLLVKYAGLEIVRMKDI